ELPAVVVNDVDPGADSRRLEHGAKLAFPIDPPVAGLGRRFAGARSWGPGLWGGDDGRRVAAARWLLDAATRRSLVPGHDYPIVNPAGVENAHTRPSATAKHAGGRQSLADQRPAGVDDSAIGGKQAALAMGREQVAQPPSRLFGQREPPESAGGVVDVFDTEIKDAAPRVAHGGVDAGALRHRVQERAMRLGNL